MTGNRPEDSHIDDLHSGDVELKKKIANLLFKASRETLPVISAFGSVIEIPGDGENEIAELLGKVSREKLPVISAFSSAIEIPGDGEASGS